MINEVANMRKDMFPHASSFTPERWPRMGKEPMLPHNYQLLPLAPVAPLLHAHISVLTAKVSNASLDISFNLKKSHIYVGKLNSKEIRSTE